MFSRINMSLPAAKRKTRLWIDTYSQMQWRSNGFCWKCRCHLQLPRNVTMIIYLKQASVCLHQCAKKLTARWNYTVSQKSMPLDIWQYLWQMGRFSKFFHQFIRKKNIYVYARKISTLPEMCYYNTLWNSKIQKYYQIFTLNVTLICLTKI